ncbi:hypothetical cytosolic protein [Syntrophus aciditrophicus SB]|uniref:Hypothetical cytosolic protein n=1 Tax=Syntrophus aciditrophicus (strain SB) TaxID=56780 RepID=Q2LRW2_SYNAS|nr:hypothetical cytosolic protein [Syntrophus aciditrophicus SB]
MVGFSEISSQHGCRQKRMQPDISDVQFKLQVELPSFLNYFPLPPWIFLSCFLKFL